MSELRESLKAAEETARRLAEALQARIGALGTDAATILSEAMRLEAELASVAARAELERTRGELDVQLARAEKSAAEAQVKALQSQTRALLEERELLLGFDLAAIEEHYEKRARSAAEGIERFEQQRLESADAALLSSDARETALESASSRAAASAVQLLREQREQAVAVLVRVRQARGRVG